MTAADRATEDADPRAPCRRCGPDDGFLGEESGAGRARSGLTWVVDPIDGTVNYLYDLPNWSVSIAVVEGDPDPTTWTALAGAVPAPALGELFTATAGDGAYRGSTPRLAVRPPWSTSTMRSSPTGFHYTDRTSAPTRPASPRQLLPRIRDIRRAGGAALDLAAVASGRLDAFYEQGLSPWDQAAGALLVRERRAASLTGLAGAAPTNRMVIAGAPRVVHELDDLLQRLGA